MKRKLAIIHTTPVTVSPLKQLAGEWLPDCEVINWVDDSILPQLAENGGDVRAVEERLCTYAIIAEKQGADCILSACSSVGEVAERMQQQVDVPVVRIDEEMAERAVRGGKRIGVAATLQTTLAPTMKLLERKASRAGVKPLLKPMLCEEAYRKLLANDQDGHDAALAASLGELAAESDVVVLAQASMARVVERLPDALKGKFLSSPSLGMARVKQVMQA